MSGRCLAAAQHEAAHVVVGVALGLRLRVASVAASYQDGRKLDGYARFDGRCGTTEAFGLMLAAGVAWERNVTGSDTFARGDLGVLREMHIRTPARVAALARASWSLLRELGPVHARLTRALVERDLTGADLTALARGEALPGED